MPFLMALLVAACSPTPSPSPNVTTQPLLAPSPTPAPTLTLTPTPSQTAVSTTRHLSVGSIELDYPSDWSVMDQGWPTTGMGQTLAIIGTLPWGSCAPSDLNCHYQLRLDPGQITVEIGTLLLAADNICDLGRTRSDLAARGPSDPQATGSLTRVDGRPAVRTDYAVGQTDYYHSDEWRDWLIAAPGTTTSGYTINAMYRGPGLETLRAELDQLVASVRLGPSTAGNPTQPTDCGSPFPS